MHALDEFFHRKYEDVDEDDGATTACRCATAEEMLAEQEAQRRRAHPHAVAVVLADRPGLGPARHRLRRHLRALLIAVGGAVLLLAAFGWALEPSAVDQIE